MSYKTLMVGIGYAVSWFIVMPLLFVTTGVALATYALLTELADALIGDGHAELDHTTAREVAQRVCLRI